VFKIDDLDLHAGFTRYIARDLEHLQRQQRDEGAVDDE
jgi:hypothetical protein